MWFSALKLSAKRRKSAEQVLVGESDRYEARCRNHIEYFEELEMNSSLRQVKTTSPRQISIN